MCWTPWRRHVVCSEHQGILDALVTGDVVQAQKAIDEHLASTKDSLFRN
ncbi:FCD domain-containing protein [Arthrobacter globiformis]|nr:FCD domain-containing protein [Arthrobacter globiformis]